MSKKPTPSTGGEGGGGVGDPPSTPTPAPETVEKKFCGKCSAGYIYPPGDNFNGKRCQCNPMVNEGGGAVGDPPPTPADAPEAAPGASEVAEVLAPPKVIERRRLPDTRQSVTKKISINHLTEDGPVATLDLYVTVGLYDDGTPGEIFARAGKMGSTVSGLLDSVCICMSIGLQSGVPLDWYVTKLKGMKFEPEGTTSDPKIRRAGSMIDAIMRWLERRFITKEE